MPGPFIFIATNKLKEGKLEDEKRRVPELSDFIEANEPRLIAFNEYADVNGAKLQLSRCIRTRSQWSSTWRSFENVQRERMRRRWRPPRGSRCSVLRAPPFFRCFVSRPGQAFL